MPTARHRGAHKRQLMSREAFEHFVGSMNVPIYARAPYEIAPCDCGDLVCHGWRLIERFRPVSETSQTPSETRPAILQKTTGFETGRRP